MNYKCVKPTLAGFGVLKERADGVVPVGIDIAQSDWDGSA
jgi:hypothetical protein